MEPRTTAHGRVLCVGMTPMRTLAAGLIACLAMGCSSATTAPAGPSQDAAGADSKDAPAGGDAGRVPAAHRAAAEPCPTDTTKADCSGGCAAACTDGANGRCMQGIHTCACRYDACVVAADCGPGKSCSCRTKVLDARGSNLCIDSNCDVDADCGSTTTGYCSPTFDTVCGPFDGVIGWYCHTPKDTCVDDAECTAGGKIGYCAFVKAKAHWECAYAVCTG